MRFMHTGKRKMTCNVPLLGNVCFPQVYRVLKQNRMFVKKINFEGPSIGPSKTFAYGKKCSHRLTTFI